MSNVAKLKKQAAELELKKQFDKALAIYVKLLDSFDENPGELDVALFNRVGDLMLRQGSVADAVDYYEKAVDRYADTGFFNNAIALCNKILRHSPGRATVYYKLGKISAQKGFKNDAKVNFLEYADRMHKAGKPEEAFRALKEFADLCPDQDEIRLMLADQLTKAGKKPEAIEQLQTLYERYESEGRSSESAATAERIRAIDPEIELRATAERSYQSKSGDLIFLNLDDDEVPTPRRGTPAPSQPVSMSPTDSRPTVIAEPILNEVILDEPVVESSLGDESMLELTRIDDDNAPVDRASGGSMLGLESTQLVDDDVEANLPSSSLLDLEPTSFGGMDLPSIPGLDAVPEDAVPGILDTNGIVADPGARTSGGLDAIPLDGLEPTTSDEFETLRASGQMPRVSGDLPMQSGRTSSSSNSLPDFDDNSSNALEFILPDADEPEIPDLGLPEPIDESAITASADAPSKTAADESIETSAEPTDDVEPQREPGVLRPTPRTTRAALEGLPVMDLDAAADSTTTPEETSPRESTPTARVSVPTPRESTPASRVSTPAERTSTPTPRVSEPAERVSTPAPRATTPAPRISEPTPRAAAPTPRTTTPMPRISEPIPRVSAPVSRDSTPAPRVSTPALATETESLTEQSGDQETLAPVEASAVAESEEISSGTTDLPATEEIVDDTSTADVESVTEAPRTTRALGRQSLDDLAAEVADEYQEEATEEEQEEAVEDEEELAPQQVPSMAGRRSTMVAAQSAELLRAAVEGEPENWDLRRQLAERLLDAGERTEGINELDIAMTGAERVGDLDLASALAEEIARLEPDVVRHHQKRVEYAFRTSDRARLIDAYLGLADALLRADQPDKSRAVYQRVIDLAPDDVRARAALDTIVVPTPVAPTPALGRASTQRRTSTAQRPTPPPPPAETPTPAQNDGFVNLGDWLRDEEAPKDTRMVVAEQEPTGDEDADFADMLKKFKQGVAENVDAEDYQSHYDLAIAFKEMGLIDEAIAEFQKALGSPHNRVPTFESLGQCFLEKKQYKLASSILSRALAEHVPDDKLVGVLYLLGICAEAQGNMSDALAYYQRVFIVDIQFRDIAERLSGAERAAR